jgi:hypothetical protein
VGWSLAASACVTDTTVIGDERTRYACTDAPILDVPPFGCTTVRLPAVGPWGCSVVDRSSNWLGELSGSWVRLHTDGAPATVRVQVITTPSFCRDDGGLADAGIPSSECAVQIHMRRGGSPCACLEGSLESTTLPPMGVWEGPMTERDQEILVEPVGAEVEVSLCTAP